MAIEFFKAFPLDLDTPLVELQIRDAETVHIVAEVHLEGGQPRITLFGRVGGNPADFAVDEWISAIRHAVDLLGD